MKKSLIILIHALIGWALCGSIIGVGRVFTTMENTLIIHALAVPIIFGVISFIYFKYFHYTTPLQTAFIFMGFAIFMDAAVVATFIEKSYEMFLSPLGTWIPFASNFLVTYLVGRRFE
jgi:hypothetical protein